MPAEELELVEVTADAMGWDDGHAWCPCGAEMVVRDNTAALVCPDCSTGALTAGSPS